MMLVASYCIASTLYCSSPLIMSGGGLVKFLAIFFGLCKKCSVENGVYVLLRGKSQLIYHW
jgi:hypothetical protein